MANDNKDDTTLDSISSSTSIGFDSELDQAENSLNDQRKTNRNNEQSLEKCLSLFTVFENELDNCFFNVPNDIICLLLICPQHNKIALQQLLNFYFFPSLIHFSDQSLNEQITTFVFNSIFPNGKFNCVNTKID